MKPKEAEGKGKIARRDFLKAAPVAAGILVGAAKGAGFAPAALAAESGTAGMAGATGAPAMRGRVSSARRLAAPGAPRKIEAFDYQGVTLRPSRWLDQVNYARQYYLGISNDDILQGFRAEAGLPAPGKPLGGWCAKDSQTVFGQWLSGMARMYRATGDTELRDKANYLLAEWTKTIKPDGDCGMHHYSWDKTVCGLVDMNLYADNAQALPVLEKITDWASKNFEHTNMIVAPNDNKMYYGRPQEWYTLSENLFRAYQLTGDTKYRDFGNVWLYHEYWNKFADTAAPANVQGVHAYSHVNTLSSAAMTYAVTEDPKYLRISRNAYDFLQNTQCYATGGYGPNERFMAADGSLGKSLDTRSDTFETLCGSWAGFKFSRYLSEFTGEARYGDWIERLLYNGSGAALAIRGAGRNFYYSDYRAGGGMKVDRWDNFTCCSGTYVQDMADYHNLIYYKDASSLYVSLYVPSEVIWNGPRGEVRVTQDTGYPETETSTMRLSMPASAAFALKLRVPGWSEGMSVKINGTDAGVACKPGEWAAISRTWNSGDKVEVNIPLRPRMQAVDREHPKRVAIVRGPVVLAMDFDYHDPNFMLPDDDRDLDKWLVADSSPAVFSIHRPDGKPVRLKFRPFYAVEEDFPYLMYVDLGAWPYALW
ncbi:MAG TPA: beta-L-arabinofuranosidase domain-containing protein [Candidatus Acidoferrales bacterium]|nr:beta-L-arabinofuranosidase domain-containing protein [Candidatus Acidoferrales bacterium]